MSEQKNPLVSVIVPVYNVEMYLCRCIDSILAQTYRNFELILVDDGSPDNSGATCDAYAGRDSRINVIHKENGGVSSARNAGLDSAVGDYILFVDSDDHIAPEHIELLIPTDEEDLVCCSMTQSMNGTASFHNIRSPQIIPKDKWEEDFWPFWKENAILSPCLSCYRMDILQQHHIRFDSRLHIGEDEQFNLQYFKYCKKIRFTQSCTYFYECGDHDSAMQKFHPTRLCTAIALSEAVENITGTRTYDARWYHWHGAIHHLNKWKLRTRGVDKKMVSKKLRECFNEPFFRSCIPYMRTNGTLDEKIETYFMRSWLHPLYKPFYSLIVVVSRIKNQLLH